MKVCLSLIFAYFFLLICCETPNKITLPFDFNHPAEIIRLPHSLHEISGITFYKKNELACIQDEKGIIYFYNIKKDKLRNTVTFSRDRDYEGIANVNDTLFVLCSNGEISEIDSTNETGYASTYSTFLSRNNNCEGLCYDEKFHRLLIACKGKPKKGTASHGMKAVYGFDLSSRTLEKNPAYVIDPDSVQKYLLPKETTGFLEKYFYSGNKKGSFLFEPSELCIDPVTKDIYMLSSVGNTILSMTFEGKIKFAVNLDPEIYKQPEGLTFSNDGNMYISDEGRSGRANLIRVNRIVL